MIPKEEILKTLEPLFVEAIEKMLWFYQPMYALWMSPASLRTAHANGKFIWGAANWQLRDPKEHLAELKEKVKAAKIEYAEFKAKLEEE